MKYRVQTDGSRFIVQWQNDYQKWLGIWKTESEMTDVSGSTEPIYFNTQEEAIAYIQDLLNPPGKVTWKTVYEVEQ